MGRTIIRHIQGNEITIAFPIMEVEAILNDGSYSDNREENRINGDVWLVLNRGLCRLQYKPTVQNNYIVFTDHGHIPCGDYDMTVYYDKPREGKHMRLKKNVVLSVVDSTDEGGVYESTDFDVVAYYPVIHGRESAVIIGDGYVRLMAGAGLRADIDEDSVNLRAGYGNSTVEVTENNVNININE